MQQVLSKVTIVALDHSTFCVSQTLIINSCACLRGVIANEHIKIGNNSYERVKTFKYLGSSLTNYNYIQEEIKCRLKATNSCYSVQTLLSSRLLSKKFKIEIYEK